MTFHLLARALSSVFASGGTLDEKVLDQDDVHAPYRERQTDRETPEVISETIGGPFSPMPPGIPPPRTAQKRKRSPARAHAHTTERQNPQKVAQVVENAVDFEKEKTTATLHVHREFASTPGLNTSTYSTTGPKINMRYADYSTRRPVCEYAPFEAIHTQTGVWQKVDVVHVKEVVWDVGSFEWIDWGASPAQQRPREWPKHWLWPFDVLRNRESTDGPCLNCARAPRDPCACMPWQWRFKIDWEPLRVLFHTDSMGIGVQTRTAWKKDDILGDYTGVLRPFNNTENNVYSMLIPLRHSGYSNPVGMIDATKAGNWARFINHSREQPNLILSLGRVGSQRLFLLTAARDIDLGEELKFDYGDTWCFDEEPLHEATPEVSQVGVKASPTETTERVPMEQIAHQATPERTYSRHSAKPVPVSRPVPRTGSLKSATMPLLKRRNLPTTSAKPRKVRQKKRVTRIIEEDTSDSYTEERERSPRKSRRQRVETEKIQALRRSPS